MKSITEFSGLVIRTAAAALVEARRSLPAEERPSGAAVADADPTSAASPQGENEAASPQGENEAASPPGENEAVSPQGGNEPVKPQGESEAVRSALDAAVAKATGLSGERLALLRVAVEVAGSRAADVRTIRVFGPEEQVPGAKAIGGHQYVTDYLPQTMKHTTGSRKDDRGRGGKGRGGGGGGRGGGRGSGGRAGATGGFSMDSLRDDRKGERGGAGRPGGAPRGGPKK